MIYIRFLIDWYHWEDINNTFKISIMLLFFFNILRKRRIEDKIVEANFRDKYRECGHALMWILNSRILQNYFLNENNYFDSLNRKGMVVTLHKLPHKLLHTRINWESHTQLLCGAQTSCEYGVFYAVFYVMCLKWESLEALTIIVDECRVLHHALIW